MATQLPTNTILGVFKALKDDMQGTVLGQRGLTIKSCGTKTPGLDHPTSRETGYWEDPRPISSKPPRWIVQVETDAAGQATARFARDPDGATYPMAHTVGYVNNRDGSCATFAFRVLIAVKSYSSTKWTFPPGWECLLLFAFATPLPRGTSGDALTEFDPTAGTVNFGGGAAARRAFAIDLRALIKVPGAAVRAEGISYADAVNAVATLSGSSVYDGASDTDRERIVADVAALFGTESDTDPFVLAEDSALFGLDSLVYRQIAAAVNSGKRHIILYGPPGTGKTTLAEYLARELSERDDSDGSYLMLTASSSWSAQDLVGGYQPIGNGQIGFIPGALLRDFDKPVIIDELNRCPIDRVLGPLFSILSGQRSTLACRTDVSNPSSPFHVILPEQRPAMEPHEHAPKAAWRLICTLNTYDKTQLGQISYALSRRFAWIKVGAPVDLEGFVVEMARRLGFLVPETISANPVGIMWRAVNAAREIGGAPIVDMLKTLRAMDPAIRPFLNPESSSADVYLAAFRMCVLPLLDGLALRDTRDLADVLATSWALDSERTERLKRDCVEFSA